MEGFFYGEMIYLKYMKTKLLRKLSLFVFAVFLLNSAGSFFSWYTLLPWYDNMMHFLGGVWLALVAIWLFYSHIEQKRAGIISVLLFVFVGVFLWEGLEYFVQAITNAPGSLATPKDSVSDMVFGLLGGFLAGLHTIKRIRNK
jgi:thiol:disulfide interchange protein